jgi:hypothetical protein
MMILPVWIEHALGVAVQCSQHSDARMHHEIAAFGSFRT